MFYSALSQVDESRQRYFTGDASRARLYYEWYRDSSDMRPIESSRMPYQWRRDLFGKLPLDDGHWNKQAEEALLKRHPMT